MVGTTSIREGGHFFQRCLGHSSCSTLGLLLLLSNWAFADCKAKGALTRGGSTMCSSELVSTFTTVFAVQGAKMTCTVYAVSGVLPLHPRPVSSAAAQFQICCSVDLVVDFRQLRELCFAEGDNGRAQATMWADALQPGWRNGWSWQMPLFDFLALCVKRKDCSILSQ